MEHNFAYNPGVSVSSWLQSTSLANEHQHATDPLEDNPPDSPDAFYRAAYPATGPRPSPPPSQGIDMPPTTRQRQAITNGARSPPKTTPRSVSGPATSTATSTSRPSPQAANRVKALAERFEKSPGASPTTTPTATRSRSRDPSRSSPHDAARRTTQPGSSPASAARPTKEAAYGSYKFNNLKPRERPQPAPAAPRTTRRTTGGKGAEDQHKSPARKKVVAPPPQRPGSSGRPFFGEVVTGQDVTSPGYGIPTFESPLDTAALQEPHNTTVDSVDQTARLPTTSYNSPRHRRGPSNSSRSNAYDGHAAQTPEHSTPQRRSPPSRIPVPTRPLSALSDSNSSTRSVKYTPTRTNNRSNRSSPTRADQSMLPALAYRGYRERGKSPKGSRNGPSVQALVTPPLPAPASPRLRNSRERQPLQPSPKAPLKSSGHQGESNYFSSKDPHHPLNIQTSSLELPPNQRQPSSATTDFEESPVLGIPGSFVLTPPTTFEEPKESAGPLLQPVAFQAMKPQQFGASPDLEQSELGVRESIPIMLGDEQTSEPDSDEFSKGLQALSLGKQPDLTLDVKQPQAAPRYQYEESPIDPLPNRSTLGPDDSASIAPYRTLGSLKFNNETYSVVNSVLNMYHQSPIISPELASISRDRVQRVSPVIAQHKDWASKEATETYLARLLSDANGSMGESAQVQPNKIISPSPPASGPVQTDLDLYEAQFAPSETPYAPQSRPYSRASATNESHEDVARTASSPKFALHDQRLQDSSHDHDNSNNNMELHNAIQLPQLAWTNGGLGLSHDSFAAPPAQPPPTQELPPLPVHSPPPPPITVPTQTIKTVSEPAVIHQNELSAPVPRGHVARVSLSDEQFAMHPARSRTPVIQTHRQTLEDRYGAPEPGPEVISPPLEGDCVQPDPAKQALIKRYRILEELLTTEHQFCIDMMIAHNIFEATAQNLMSEKEKKLLFSNCKELEKFSLSLFRSFKKAAKPIVNYEIPPPTGPWNRDSSDSRSTNVPEAGIRLRRPSEDSENQFENCTLENDRLTTIGQVFLENREKMERLYTTYFLNQENASTYIKKNQGNPELASWVVACFEQVENMTQAWDLDSLLLKPCQRLLKYPLLLEGLVACSDPDHPDLQNLKAAKAELLAINARINEAKARVDTFRAAASEGKKEKSKGKGLGKTFVKAFIPKVDKSKAYDEADKTFKDQEYKSREQKFGGHFFQLQIVMRDFEGYLDSITEHYMQLNVVFLGFITVCEVAPSIYPEVESTWRKWAMAHFELQNKALEEHKTAVRTRVLKPVSDLWEMWVSYQKTIEQRKKYLLYYVKHKQATDRGEKVDPDLEESAKKFTAINDTLKHELPLLYERTKNLMRSLMTLFMCLQKDWYKTCSKKILPLLESEPQHTTSLRYDLESYVERFNADYKPMADLANKLGIVNRNLLIDISNMMSPVPTISSDGGGSSRNSSSRRTESMGSEASMLDTRNRNSGGYDRRPQHFRNHENPPRSSPAGPAYPSLFPNNATGRQGPGPTSLREARALSPSSDGSETTVVHDSQQRRNTNPSRSQHNYLGIDSAFESSDRDSFGSGVFDFPPQLGASFLTPTSQIYAPHSLQGPTSMPTPQSTSLPSSQRASAIFTSALPMSDSPIRGSAEDLPTTPADTEEPEVLFLAASLFEFNIAHDRREGGIPYLVYVPGEIFDVIGMKGELWLARNQDDHTKTVGWIWEKHFARILPEDA